ncbi:frequency clock protein [Biscogniauxia sp. FL1348]|nr:frequency clock protein [Biscogniauxia sp. FL1348]
MPDPKNTPAGSEPPPVITYKNPRRTSPENSITLRHHRLAREASKRHSPPAVPTSKTAVVKSPRRNSSGESNETGISDPKKWFDMSNQNATGQMDTSAMDVDPPFYQKETDSSNEEGAKYAVPSQSPAYRFVQSRTSALRPDFAHSSSADDYRSVIDDLTIENKRLKEELKKYKHVGPDSLRKDKLFEVKFHGLPSRKKRELEATLRDFTTSLENSSTGASPNRKKALGKSKGVHSSPSKHASSSSGSNSRPVDSAYASMSTGPSSSSVPSLPAQIKAARQRSNQKIENYLRDIPEGLWPRPIMMTEKEKKKLVVKRLEHLFTGKMANYAGQKPATAPPPPITEDSEMEAVDAKATPLGEAAREAKIRPRELGRTTSQSRDIGSASNTHSQSQPHSHSDQMDTKDNGNDNSNGSGSGSGHGSGSGSGGRSGNNTSPQNTVPAEQRPTRPRDLDPDRKQVPSENMDYIRHLGLGAPTSQSQFSAKDVSPDAEGWVYLNLLCNLAQLHILNVTPDFIRHAVSEKSTKFQLSPDGRKIRWRGGAEGTRFSSDSSGSNSQRNQSSDDTDGSNDQDQRKKQKTQATENDVIPRKTSQFGLGVQDSNSSESFHYKPLFVHHQTESSEEQPSMGEETGSSYGPPEESNLGVNSRWGQSGVSTGMSQRKRRRDGAIIYYSGAPFCTDLSGDFGEVSPDTYDMTSSGDQVDPDPVRLDLAVDRPQLSRSTSGSSIPFRPLSGHESQGAMMDLDDLDPPELTSGETDDDIEADFPWSDRNQHGSLINLEASGLGGIYPDDHFVVVVSTRRPKKLESTFDDSSDDGNASPLARPQHQERRSQDPTDSKATTTDAIVGKLAKMTTASPVPTYVATVKVPSVKIEYLTCRLRRLPPVPLPPPAFYFPSGDDSDFEDDDESFDDDSDSSQSLMSRRAILEDDPSDNADLSGNDEEDEHSDGGRGYDASGSISPDKMEDMLDVDDFGLGGGRGDRISGLSKLTTGSSVATAGGAASGYNSSMEAA